VLHEGTARNSRAGKAPLGVLVLVAVVVILVVVTLVRTGSSGEDATEAVVAADAGGETPIPSVERPLLLVVTDRLAELIDTARVEASQIPELEPEMDAAAVSRAQEQWRAWVQVFSQRLDTITELLPEPPAENADRNARLGYSRINQALDELRILIRSGTAGEVPPLHQRNRQLGVAENHVAVAKQYFERAGLV